MGLTTSEKKKLSELRKWVKKERRRYRLPTHPRFSFMVDYKTKNITYRYSVHNVIGYDIEKDEPITKLKKKNGYTTIPIKEYQLLNIRSIYNSVKKEIERAGKSAQKESVNLPYWIEEYCSTEIRNGKIIEQRTLNTDRVVLEQYAEWLRNNHPKHLDIYTHLKDGRKILEKYLIELSNTKTRFGKPFAKNTISGIYRRIKGFFNWLSEKDETFPYNMLRMKGWGQERNKDKLPPAVSVDDMKKLIGWLDENIENKYERHFTPILRMLLITGCRIGEIVTMKIEDVDVKNKLWKFYSKGSWRTIKLDSKTLWNDLSYWLLDENGKKRTDKQYVFHSEYWRRRNKNGKGGGIKMNLNSHISISGVEHKFKKVITELGLDTKLTPHSCRRGFISYMLEKENGNVPLVAQLVGHKSWEMVYRYNRERLPKQRTTIDLGEVLKEE